MFRLRNVSKRYGVHSALVDVTLDITAGLTTVLLGPSGCGKTTLLKLLLGMVQPDAGTISFDGATLPTQHIDAVRRRIGYVIQQGGLFPHLSATRNVTLLAEHLRWPRQRIATRLAELAAITRLPIDALDRYPRELSGGQNQRVALMRGLFMNPDALLLDEPLGGLDPMVRHELQQDLREIFSTLGKTVVLVTHDLAEAAHFAHRIALLRAGRVVQVGTLENFLSAPADPFVSQFIRAQSGPFTPATSGP